MRYLATFCLLLFISSFSFAQQKPATPVASVASTNPAPIVAPTPTVAPTPVQISAETENKILKAEHALDQLKADEQDAAQQFDKVRRQSDELIARYKADKDREPGLTSAMNEAIEQAWKASGLAKDKYMFDPANFSFVPKPEPKAPAVAKVEPPKAANK